MNSRNLFRDDGAPGRKAPEASPGRRELITRVGAAVAFGTGIAARGAAQPNPSIAFASWIHGNTGRVERQEFTHKITPFGFGLEVQSTGPMNWVHYGIPTPVIVNEKRLKILRVMLVFDTPNTYSRVQNVHVWDGSVRLANIDGLSLSGHHPFESFPIPGTPSVQFGITVSIGFALTTFEFGPQKFGFISTGADFA